MNDETQQHKKDSILKSLAILGFIGIIVSIAWLSVKLVDLAPSAFSSLASLAETIQKERVATSTDEVALTTLLPLTSNTTLLNSGESVTVSWGAASIPGSYTFSYECTDGIAIDLIDVPDLSSITCDTDYNVGEVTELHFSVDSAKERYADVRYTISFFGTNNTTPRASGTTQLTVVNGDIKNVIATTVTNDEEAVVEPTPTTPEPPVEETPVTPVIPTPETVTESTPPKVTPPTYTEEIVYVTPVSDPNGRTDIGVRFLGTGSITNNVFVSGLLTEGKPGAIQFEVKNYGTRTSTIWTFSVALPDGSTYRSPAQAALKPNERALLTIGFAASTVREHTFVVIASEPTDQYKLNDSFQQPVTFVK